MVHVENARHTPELKTATQFVTQTDVQEIKSFHTLEHVNHAKITNSHQPTEDIA